METITAKVDITKWWEIVEEYDNKYGKSVTDFSEIMRKHIELLDQNYRNNDPGMIFTCETYKYQK